MSRLAGPQSSSPKRRAPLAVGGDTMKNIGRALSASERRRNPDEYWRRYWESTHGRKALKELSRRTILELALEIVRREREARKKDRNARHNRTYRRRNRAAREGQDAPAPEANESATTLTPPV